VSTHSSARRAGEVYRGTLSTVDRAGAAPERQLRLRSVLMPPLVGALLVLPSFVWAALDRSIWIWDPAWYGAGSIDLWATLRNSPERWASAMVHAFGVKPPAIAWVGQFFVPLGGTLGSDQAALLFSVVLMQAVSVTLVYIVGRRLAGGRIIPALCGALLTASAPLFVALSHSYFVEPIQTTSVSWVLFIMVSARRWHVSLTVAQLIAAISLGLLAKLTTPLYVAAPACVGLLFSVSAVRIQARSRWWLEKRFSVSAVLATALACATAAWYDTNFHATWRQARLAAGSTLYGTEGPFVSKLDFWFHRLGDALFLPYFDAALGALLVGGAAVLVVRRHEHQFRASSYPVLALLGSIGVPIAALISLAAQVNQDDRFLLPVVPALAVALVAILTLIDVRIVAGLLASLFAGQFALTTLQSFDSGKPAALAYSRVSLPAEIPKHLRPAPLTYSRLHQPVGKSGFATELDRVVRLTCTNSTGGRINMVGTNYPWLNYSTLQMLAFAKFAEDGRRCHYTALGDDTDANGAWQKLRRLKSPFYVTVDYGNPRNPLPRDLVAETNLTDVFNRINVAVLRRVTRSGLYTVVPGSRRRGLVVLRLASATSPGADSSTRERPSSGKPGAD
jgi:hypothetical protein